MLKHRRFLRARITISIQYAVKTGTIVPDNKNYKNKCHFGGQDWEYMV